MTTEATSEQWRKLAELTPARIGLGRTGASLSTTEVLRFALAHAQARDAVRTPFQPDAIVERLKASGCEAIQVSSRAATRDEYLRRPDLGRALSAAGASALDAARGSGPDVAVIVGDGLSSTAVHEHAVPCVAALRERFVAMGLATGPIIVASGARVALGDAVGERLGARSSLVLIGERPGLSSPDSLGAYLTFGPRAGRTDAERNCVSNIRLAGLSYEVAAFRLAWLIDAALTRGLSGVDLKDESAAALPSDRADAIAAVARDDGAG